VGKSRASVANSLRLLSLAVELQGYVSKGLLSTGHAKVLLGLDDASHRLLLARRIIGEGLSVRASEKLIKEAGSGGTDKPVARRRPSLQSADAATVQGIEKKLTSRLGARVAVFHSAKKGRIVIEYRGNEDLQRILEKIGVEIG
jgi:ParB family chromosome partitioning protein